MVEALFIGQVNDSSRTVGGGGTFTSKPHIPSVLLIAFSILADVIILCYVVGSRRLMPPDALQPKAYCTNPVLQLFLLAPPGVSTRDPSSERKNYLGEEWPAIWTESCDFHAYTFGFFYMPQICDMGRTALLPF